LPVVELDTSTKPLVLALDIGTSSTRALIFDCAGRTLRGSECQIEFELTTTPDGGAEVDPIALLDLVCQSIDGVLRQSPVEIAAVGVASFWHSLMGIDRSGAPTTPVYLWADTRSRVDIDDIKRKFDPDELWRRTGCFVHSSYWAGKLRWLGRTAPEVVEQTTRWCAFSDYLLNTLFGAEGTSISMASSTALMNASTHEWDELAVKAAGVDPETLPSIRNERQPHTSIGAVYARRWPALASCPWFGGIGDGGCANVGSGGIGPSRIALTVGTSGALRMIAALPKGKSSSAPASLWTYRLDDQRAVIGAAISNGGKVIDWLAELTGTTFGGPEMDEAATLEPDGHGLTILPFLAGERAPIWSDWATGGITGLTLATTAADLFQAAMESVSYRLAMIYAELATQADADHQIVANGGAILRSEPWLQMLADVTQHPIVTLPPDEESTARGAALVALEYAGLISDLADASDPVTYGRVIEPDSRRADVYQAAMGRQNHLLELLYDRGKPRLDSAQSAVRPPSTKIV
jgi:gluconokinase